MGNAKPEVTVDEIVEKHLAIRSAVLELLRSFNEPNVAQDFFKKNSDVDPDLIGIEYIEDGTLKVASEFFKTAHPMGRQPLFATPRDVAFKRQQAAPERYTYDEPYWSEGFLRDWNSEKDWLFACADLLDSFLLKVAYWEALDSRISREKLQQVVDTVLRQPLLREVCHEGAVE